MNINNLVFCILRQALIKKSKLGLNSWSPASASWMWSTEGMCSLAKHSGYFSYCYCHCAKYKTAEEPKTYVVSHSQRIQSVLAGRAKFTLLRARKQRKPESRTRWLSPFPSFVLSGALAKEKALLAFRVQFPHHSIPAWIDRTCLLGDSIQVTMRINHLNK